jgi:hypothetical protein
MENEVEKKSELHIVKSESPCPNADAPLNKSERKKLEDLTKKLMVIQDGEKMRKEAIAIEDNKVYRQMKLDVVRTVLQMKSFADADAKKIREESDVLVQYIHNDKKE